MALKIISNNDNVQEDKAIDYPCLMESIDPDPMFKEHTCIVLALSENSGIAIVSTFNKEMLGIIDDNWISFEDKGYWKPYDKPVTFVTHKGERNEKEGSSYN